MEKSKCKAKAAALLMALVILFIPFGSAFAAGRSYVSNLAVDDGFTNWLGHSAYRGYTNHNGTYYIRQGYANAYLEGDFVNVGTSFTLYLEVIDYDSERTIRRVTSTVNIPSGYGTPTLAHLCNPGNRNEGSIFCSKEMTRALDLRTLPAGRYNFSFFVNQKEMGTSISVRVYPGAVEDFVMNANYEFGLRRTVQSFDQVMYKLGRQEIKGTDFLWDLYVQNQAKGAFKGASSRQAIRIACQAAFGRNPTAAEEKALMTYCGVMGVPLTIKRIIYSGKCQSHLMDLGIKP